MSPPLCTVNVDRVKKSWPPKPTSQRREAQGRAQYVRCGPTAPACYVVLEQDGMAREDAHNAPDCRITGALQPRSRMQGVADDSSQQHHCPTLPSPHPVP